MITPINNSAVSPQSVGLMSSSTEVLPAARRTVNQFQSSMEGGLLQNLRKQVGKLFNQLVDQVSGRQPVSGRFSAVMERTASTMQVRGIADRAPQRDFRQPFNPMPETLTASMDQIRFGSGRSQLQSESQFQSQPQRVISRDSVFLGCETDYPQAVLAVRVGDDVKPVQHENGQIVARHLNLGNATEMPGALIFADGSEMALRIDILRAI